MLEARGIAATDGPLVSETTGEVHVVDGVLVVRRITVVYRLSGVADDDRATVERVLGFHADKCPVARSISPQIEIETRLEYV